MSENSAEIEGTAHIRGTVEVTGWPPALTDWQVEVDRALASLASRVSDLEDDTPPPIDPPPIDPPPIDPPPPTGLARGGINISLGGYDRSAGYWYSSTPRDITHANILKMMELGITHIRGNYSPQYERNPDVLLEQVETILNAGCTLTLANHSWCTGADPSNHDRVMQGFRRLLTAGSTAITNAARDGRFRISPWNEPSGHATYKGGFEAVVTHSNLWVDDHQRVMKPLLEVEPELGFDCGEPHGGNGGRRATTSCNAYWGLHLADITTDDLRADIHKYQGWKPGYTPDFVNMTTIWPYPVTIGEFGGDPHYARRGKGPNHHSNIAYPSSQDLLDNWAVYAAHAQEITMWHGYQAWLSGFTLSDLHDPNTGQGRYAPWEIDGHPKTLVGGQFLDHLAADQIAAAVPLDDDVDELTRLADTLEDT